MHIYAHIYVHPPPSIHPANHLFIQANFYAPKHNQLRPNKGRLKDKFSILKGIKGKGRNIEWGILERYSSKRRQNTNQCNSVNVRLFLVAFIKQVHLLDILWTKVSPLANRCAVPSFDGNLPWPICKLMLAIMHYGIIVVGNTKTVDRPVAVFSKVECLAWRKILR